MQMKYNYIDLRLHSYMFEHADFDNVRSFFRHIFTTERFALEDYEDNDIYEALRRQYEEFVGSWTNECENAFQSTIDIYLRDLH